MQNKLSIFIDESGDFGPYSPHAPYYIVSMVFHEQRTDITENIKALNTHLFALDVKEHSIHTGPLIRRESVYLRQPLAIRQKLFGSLFHFARRCPFTYLTVTVHKNDCRDNIALVQKLSRGIAAEIQTHQAYLHAFDEVILYYDNGQIELTKILTSVFSSFLANVSFRKVEPVQYKLFQVADLVCTMELLELKRSTRTSSKSELDFFGNGRDFLKNYLKPLRLHRL